MKTDDREMGAALERKYAAKLGDARQAALRLSEIATERERMLNSKLHDAQQVALQMSRVASERVQNMSEALKTSRNDVLALSQSLAARERELGAELQRVHERLLTLAATAAEEARELNSRLQEAYQAIEGNSRTLRERERELDELRITLAHSAQLIDDMRRVLSDASGSLFPTDDVEEHKTAPALVGVVQLLTLRGQRFVDEAYRVLLHRDPDPAGRQHYLDELSDGVSRMEIVRRLRYSPEGKTVSADVRGIRARLAVAFLCHIPLVGRWFEAIADAASLFTHARRRRAFEHSVMEELERAKAANLEKSRYLLRLQQLIARIEKR